MKKKNVFEREDRRWAIEKAVESRSMAEDATGIIARAKMFLDFVTAGKAHENRGT
jgi:hypothetical protein